MAFLPIPAGMFAPYNPKTKFTYKPVVLDANLLSSALESQLAVQIAPQLKNFDESKLPSDRDPSIIAPWQLNSNEDSLASRIAQVRTMDKFVDIDPRLSGIQLAQGDKTSQNLFAMYRALDALKTIAQYAAEANTLSSSLPRLDTQFQQGLQEIKDFLPTAELGKISMFFGNRQSSVTAPIGLGSDTAVFETKVIQTGTSDDPLANIVGNEQFTIKMVHNGTTTVNVNIDLANITGTISVNSVVDYINTEIAAQAPTFQTSFEVKKDANYDFSIGISGSSLETVEFIAVAAEPALYVASDFTSYTNPTEVGTLTKLSDAESIDPTRATSTTVAGTDTEATAIAKQIGIDEAAADDSEVEETGDVAATTTTSGIATDSQGFIYVLGQTQGDLDDQFNGATGNDVFLNKYNSLGELVDSKLVGAGGDASAYSIMVDSSDNVIIAGQTSSSLLSTDAVSGLDSFVTKYDRTGKEIFTYQLDTVATDFASSLAVDASGDIYVGGTTSGAINSTSGFGGVRDGMIIKLGGTTGTVLDTQLLGGAGNEQIKSIAISGAGGVIVTLVEDGNAIIRNLDATDLSVENYNLSLGDIGSGEITDTYIDNDQLYIVGYTDNTALDAAGSATIVNAHAGATDGFVFSTQLNATDTTQNYLTYVGGAGTDKINDVTFANGNLYVAGGTSGSVNGETTSGINDSFVASLDAATGAVNYVEQFGQSLGTSAATGVAFVSSGTSVLNNLGLPSGQINISETRTLVDQTSLRTGDSFFISVNGGTKRRVTIDADDTVASLVVKINAISTTYLKAEEITGENGDTLKISAVRGATIELFAGDKERDALSKMGMEAGKMMSAEILANIDPDPFTINDDDLGGVFSFSLSTGLKVLDKTTAKYAITKLETAISNLQRAYRSLVVDPTKLKLLEDAKLDRSVGTAPAYLTARIANFQDALNRLQGSTQQSSTSLFT
ncbi:MAG: SBBP repeat-containing protein [Sphingomonadales bacterium]|nr:SBBP repeat-containing protein [Sphingomonadales bacterium]